MQKKVPAVVQRRGRRRGQATFTFTPPPPQLNAQGQPVPPPMNNLPPMNQPPMNQPPMPQPQVQAQPPMPNQYPMQQPQPPRPQSQPLMPSPPPMQPPPPPMQNPPSLGGQQFMPVPQPGPGQQSPSSSGLLSRPSQPPAAPTLPPTVRGQTPAPSSLPPTVRANPSSPSLTPPPASRSTPPAGIPAGYQEQPPSQMKPPQARVLIEIDGNVIKTVPLNKPSLAVGRLNGNDVQIPNQRVSRLHAKIVADQGVWVIEDAESVNGVVYQGKRVKRLVLNNGDRVYLAPNIVLQYEAVQ